MNVFPQLCSIFTDESNAGEGVEPGLALGCCWTAWVAVGPPDGWAPLWSMGNRAAKKDPADDAATLETCLASCGAGLYVERYREAIKWLMDSPEGIDVAYYNNTPCTTARISVRTSVFCR
jgi:hypothetical protein